MADWRDRMKVIEARLDKIQDEIDFLKSQMGLTFADPVETKTEFTPEPEEVNENEK